MVKYLKTKKNSINNKKIRQKKTRRNRNRNRKNKNYIIGGNDVPPEGRFWVEITNNRYGNVVYRCLDCNEISGTAAVTTNPYNPEYFQHNLNCRNRNTLNVPLIKSIDINKNLEP